MDTATSSTPAPLSQREYGKRRGVSHVAVQRAIKRGRLSKSVDAAGRIIDPELADREWDANTDLSKAPVAVREKEPSRPTAAPPARRTPEVGAPVEAPSPVWGGTLAENNAAKAYWQARQAALDFSEAAGELVPAKDVEAKLRDVFSTCRTKLLAIPSRVRQRLPKLSVAQIAVIEELIREALDGLADESGDKP